MSIKKRRRIEFASALRSGKYAEGAHYLKYKESRVMRFCVWGVGCELYRTYNPQTSRWIKKQNGIQAFEIDGLNYPLMRNISGKVMRFFGISLEGAKKIIDMTDEHRTFEDVANYIEKYGEERKDERV